MSKKNRRSHRETYYDAKATPTHFVRLHRLKVVIDDSKRWYVVRIDPAKEKKVRQSLESAGFETQAPADVTLVPRKGRPAEDRKRPSAGYVFVGVSFPPGAVRTDTARLGRERLWRFHDEIVSNAPPIRMLDSSGRECFCRQPGEAVRPFFAVLGPFNPKDLQEYADKIKPEPMAVLYENGEPVVRFPAAQAGIYENERLIFCGADAPGLAEQKPNG